MALKLTVTPSSNYIEDSINIRITGGTIPSNYRLTITSWDNYPNYNDGRPIKIYNGNLSSNFNCTFTSAELSSTYNYSQTRTKIPVQFSLDKPVGSSSYETVSTFWKWLYIKPEPPTFDITPTYADWSQPSLNLTNDNQMIVRGLSYIRITNLNGHAYKGALLKTIKVNNITMESYEDVIDLGFIYIDYTKNIMEPYLDITLIDTRNFSKTYRIADISKFKYSYQVPRITELNVEHDGINETTTLNVKGYYSEGYQQGITNLTSQYSYKENTTGATEQQGATSLTISKNISYEYQEFLDILSEYNTPNYLIDDNNKTYYEKSTFENDIQGLFDTAITYNDKYTSEYLQADYDSTNERYYILSGGYSTKGWNGFWEDTLNEIYTKLYGNNVYSMYNKNIIGDENGGNYEFEITATIQGDIQAGFSLDKTFYITDYVDDGIYATQARNTRTQKTELLSTAIPAIDVYKNNIAIHGLYDEQIGGTQIEGSRLADFVIEFDTDGTWLWRKWQSGYVELFAFEQYSGLSITSASAGTYYGASQDIDLPFTLTELYAQSGQLAGTVSSGVYPYKIYTVSSGTKLRTEFRAHASNASASCGIKYYLIGMYR